MKTIFQILFITVCMMTAYDVLSDDNYIEKDHLMKVIKSRNLDNIVRDMNVVKRMRYSGEIMPFIIDLWDKKKDVYPDIPWDIVDKPIIRTEIADILLQANSNGLISLDIRPLQIYLRSMLTSKDLVAVSNAVSALVAIDDKEDVPLIEKVAKTGNGVTFRAAIIALSRMCTKDAFIALDNLESAIEDNEKQKYIIKTRKEMYDFIKQTNMCR
jgi:hypothetical protein